MIIEVVGGIGNQVWLYLLGQSIGRIRKGTTLYDLTHLDRGHSNHGENLFDSLGVEVPRSGKLTPHERILFGARQLLKTDKFLHPLFPSLHEQFNDPKTFKELISLSENMRVRGFFQRLSYIHEEEEKKLGDELRRKTNLLEPEIIDELVRTDVTTVHLRGGDYYSNPHLGVIPPQTYQSFLKEDQILSATERFLVFTNDEDYAERCMPKGSNFRVLGPRQLSGFQTLVAMANSARLVTANSSLSFWGGRFSAGRVFYPWPYFQEAYFHPGNISNRWTNFEVNWDPEPSGKDR